MNERHFELLKYLKHNLPTLLDCYEVGTNKYEIIKTFMWFFYNGPHSDYIDERRRRDEVRKTEDFRFGDVVEIKFDNEVKQLRYFISETAAHWVLSSHSSGYQADVYDKKRVTISHITKEKK